MIGTVRGLEAPRGWKVRSLWSVATRSKESGKPDADPLSVYLQEGVVPRSSRGDNHNQLGEDLAKYLVVRQGDLVFNKLRTWQGGLGVSKYDGIVSPAYYVCRPGQECYPQFLHYLLRSAPYLSELTRISKWMPPSQFDTPWDMLRNLPILLPPLAEQRRIADFLDAEVSRIDALMTSRRRQIDRLQERGRSVISETLIPGAATRSIGLAPWTWLPAMEDDRPLVRLGYVAQVQGGITVDAARDLNGNVVTRPYLRVANVQAGYLDLDTVTEVTVPASIARRSTLRAGDVLMTEGGDLDKLGRGAVWSGEIEGCLHQNHVFAIRPDLERLDGQYLAHMTQSIHGRCYFESTGSRTTNLASTNSSKILGFPIPLPPVRRQRELVRELRSQLASISAADILLRWQLSLLEERRQALIAAAIAGQIDVTTARGVDVS